MMLTGRGKILLTLVTNTVGLLCICYIFDTAWRKSVQLNWRQHDPVLGTKWDVALNHLPSILVGIKEQCIRSPQWGFSRTQEDNAWKSTTVPKRASWYIWGALPAEKVRLFQEFVCAEKWNITGHCYHHLCFSYLGNPIYNLCAGERAGAEEHDQLWDQDLCIPVDPEHEVS